MDVSFLASRLKGAAHVMVAEQKCAQAMKERDSAKNEAEEVFQSFAEEIDTL